MLIVALSGSLRHDSYNTALLRAAARALPPGVALQVLDGLGAVPPFAQGDQSEPRPAAVEAMWQAVAAADAALIATPEYNSSLPGQLKNVLDWMSRPLLTNPFRNKPVAVIGASTSRFGAVWAQAEVRTVVTALGARVIPDGLSVADAERAFDEVGGLVLPHRDLLRKIVGKLVAGAAERREVGGAEAA